MVPLTWLAMEWFNNGISRGLVLKKLLVTLFLIPPLVWYAIVVPKWDTKGIIAGLSGNEVPWATVLEYLRFNVISTLPELLLNYGSLLFFMAGFWFLAKNKAFKNAMFPVLAVLGLSVVGYFLYEVNMIANVHDYYLFPFLPLLFMLVSYGAFNMLKQPNKFVRYLAIMLLLILPLTAYLRMQVRWDLDSPGFNKDLLTYKQELRNAVPKDALCVVGSDESHYIYFYYVDKKGWGFDQDKLDLQTLKKMIGEGAGYLYSDSRTVDQNADIAACLGQLILEKGSVRVYKLRK
jgi:hypothetical protein